MEERNTPIERPPMLGFKQSKNPGFKKFHKVYISLFIAVDLHMFFQKVSDQGGYDGCVSKKAWKSVYDELGGNPQNTSAATCTRRHYEKFLLTYERYINNMEPGQREEHLEEAEGEELEEKKEGTTNGDAIEEEVKSESDVKPELSPVAKEEKSGEEKPRETFTPKIGIKPLQLLTEPKLADVGKEDVKMKIDDLIIIPNNINHAAEEGGSALQNLATIASRYSSLQKDKSRAADFSSPSPKKTRVEEPSVAQPLPPTTHAKKPQAPAMPSISAASDPMSSSAASSLLQQFSLLSPGLFPGFPGLPGAAPSLSPSPGAAVSSASAASPGSAAASAASWLGSSLGLDPSKIGQDGFQLLKYYEQQLKALQTGKSPRAPSPAKTNGLKDSSPTKTKDSKSKEKSKVCKLPPDTKRPPRLMQTPCPYSQTASIYGSPKSELLKARDSASKTNNNTGESVSSKPELGILDLSSSGGSGSLRLLPEPLPRHSVPAPLASPASLRAPVTSDIISPSVLNLSRPERQASVEHGAETVDLSMSRAPASEARPRPEVKASPFSAEALLSKPSPKPQEVTRSVAPPLSMGIKGLLESDMRRHSPQASPALPRASPSSGSTQSPGPGTDLRADRPSPLNSVTGSKPGPRQATPSSSFATSIPASLAALYSAGYGLGPAVSSIPGLSTETTFSSLSSLSSSSLAPPSLPQSQQNPYLSALMASPSMHGHQQAAALAAASKAQAPAAPGYPGLNPLDPASQYYAALYQQQVSAYQHAASAAALSPYGIRPGYPGGHAAGAGAANAAAAAELQALQQYKDMMTRAAGAQASQAQAAAAAAANPYAALYGLMGYPGGFPGVPGQRKDP